MARDDDASFEPEALTQRPLRKSNFLGIANRSKRVKKNDFCGVDGENVSEILVMSGAYEVSALL